MLTHIQSDFYPVQAAVARGHSAHTLFSSPDIPHHNAIRKAINPAFTATQSVSYESFIHDTISVYLEQLNARFAGKKGPEGVFDLGTWMLYYTFDVIGELTYGARHGFMEAGKDSQGLIPYVQKFLVYGYIVRFPSLRSKDSHITLSGGSMAHTRQVPSAQPCPSLA